MKDMAYCCEAAGGAQAKTGDNRKALSRPAGYHATVAAYGSRTRSRHAGSSVANHYTAPPAGYGSNENIKGYGG